MSDHPIVVLSRKYPQLLLPVKNGEKDTEEYKDAVLRGKAVEGIPEFTLDCDDSLSTVSTPAGDVEVLTLIKREDFEHAIKCLAYRCEDKAIPASMGASSLSGLINWEKLRPHMESDEDFNEFTKDKNNYLDSLIILSSGPYSAVNGSVFSLDEDTWRDKSIEIRKYHELTHFISGKMYPGNKEALRDEVIADMIGIIAAFGEYDTYMARVFLGIEGEEYREGGRLQNYIGSGTLSDAVNRTLNLIELFDGYLKNIQKESIFNMLISIEGDRLGI